MALPLTLHTWGWLSLPYALTHCPKPTMLKALFFF